MRFYRLCVDIDRAGQVIGASYEAHHDREVDGFGTVLVGPFTTRPEALEACVSACVERYGVQLAFAF